MATKSILKNVTIRDRKSAEMLVNALEKAEKVQSKEVIAPKATVASVDDIRKMLGISSQK